MGSSRGMGGPGRISHVSSWSGDTSWGCVPASFFSPFVEEPMTYSYGIRGVMFFGFPIQLQFVPAVCPFSSQLFRQLALPLVYGYISYPSDCVLGLQRAGDVPDCVEQLL